MCLKTDFESDKLIHKTIYVHIGVLNLSYHNNFCLLAQQISIYYYFTKMFIKNK